MANRLINEESPYLLQHAHNPVEWYPWGEEAFKKAQRDNLPIFLSIGYSSCHWCHVMEREVFENEKIAAFLNDRFVSIKVDREERPDIDKHYQSVHALLNQRPGGWPLSIFMTPDKKPFFAGTYIPPARKYNMMGFLELIEIIHEKWSKTPDVITKNAEEIERFLSPKDGPVKATRLDLSLIERALGSCEESFDSEWGGFSKAPKFPHTSALNLLMQIYGLTGMKKPLEMVEKSLVSMARGGLYDLVDGGFCRYSTDDLWLIPHFEKMTYDNALLTQTYLEAFRITRNPFYLRIAEETISFMQEKMSEDGLFFSASDADSEGEEGKYFVYSHDEVAKALQNGGFKQELREEICEALQITERGNYEGKNIVRCEDPARYSWWPKVREILRSIREDREYPFLDKKVITSWNAMMIKALFMAAHTDQRHLEPATHSLNRLLKSMYRDGILYHSALIGSEPKIEAFLEDYAYLCDALLQAYRTTLDESWLELADKLAGKAERLFYEEGKWYFSRGEFPTEADISDTSYPASSAIMTNVLLTLGSLHDESRIETAFRTLEYNSIKIVKQPIWRSAIVTAALRYLKEDLVVKSLPNRLADAKEVIDRARYPYTLLKSEVLPEYLLCNRHSCFASCATLEELEESLKSAAG